MKSVALVLCLLFSSLMLSAQINTPATKLNTMSTTDWNNVFSGLQPLVTPKFNEVKGSPFLYDQYLLGAVYLTDSVRSPGLNKFKLNIFDNEIWLQKDSISKAEIILTNPRLVGLVLTKDGITHTFKRLALPSVNTTPVRKFAEIFYCGSLTLIKETQKEYLKSDRSDQSVLNGNSDQSSFETKEIYYLADENGSIKKVRLRLTDILELYPTVVMKHKVNIDHFCKSKNINKSLTETQLVDLLNYLSSIRMS